MQSFVGLNIFFFLIIITTATTTNVFTLKMHHRFSDPVKKWASQNNNFPPKGSVEFYSQLTHHDRLFRGRGLSDSRLTFSDGNSSFRIKGLAYLHYTIISLGTPGQKFFVALDTGSDLFWVPCECRRCASIDNTPYSSKFNMSIYDPKESSTSKKVTCNHRMCTASCPGSGTVSTCPYSSSYVSSQTSTSGILLEDCLHLETDDNYAKVVNAFVTFGCGQVQTGSLLHVAAPNGIFGLGMEKLSVPGILAREGYIADSFSMCFGHDGTGRISFGDKGSIDQEETPFCFDASHPTYTITATQLRFHAQTKDSRRLTDKSIPFEYCYAMSSEANTSQIPALTLTMKGSGQFNIYNPVVIVHTRPEVVYCLAVMYDAEMSIIGQNFMTGYRIIFDREKLVLGWKKSSCYDIDNSTSFSSRPLNTSVPPAVAAGLEGEGNRNRDYSSAVSSTITNCYLNYNCIYFLIIHSFVAVIILPYSL
uniref:aspartyl protease family protein 1-like isoform X2 n=1 Tax=Erigeron canadensis TaxID=72917 RepID=UPI001CB94EB1|nr:aspartyl protease family protein 1-like isoform X2 [Erigeron canadensis]